MAEQTFGNTGVDAGFNGFGDVDAAFLLPSTVTEQVPNDDGVLTVGETVIFDGPTGDPQDAIYLGTADDVDGIVLEEVSTGNRLVLSDDAITAGSTTSNFTEENTPICFAAGTLISTPEGDVPVEALRIGQAVLTAAGRQVPVKWLGRHTVSKRFTPDEFFRPVRVSACALGADVPRADLILTKDHALVIGGVLVHAGALVNGSSIVEVDRSELDDKMTYYHVEVEEHDVILANGALAETFIDNVSRRRFDNYKEFELLYGGETEEMAELELARATSPR